MFLRIFQFLLHKVFLLYFRQHESVSLQNLLSKCSELKARQTLKISSKSEAIFRWWGWDNVEISSYKTKNVWSLQKQAISTNSFYGRPRPQRSTRWTKSWLKISRTSGNISSWVIKTRNVFSFKRKYIWSLSVHV